MKNITVVGAGYVGLANGVALSQHHNVTIHDIDANKIHLLNKKKSPIRDELLSEYLKKKELNLKATSFADEAYIGADYVIVATPTDYDPQTNYFNLNSVYAVVAEALKQAPKALIVVKSTVPIGFCEEINKYFKTDKIIFSPEFLREGSALHDCIHPSRIVVGSIKGIEFSDMLHQAAQGDPEVIITGDKEAEAIKLFANSYLALRVAFFNELDTYSEFHKLNTREIIDGVCMDPRIGKGYANPSFGYGGYCFPKDTKQLLANFRKDRIPQRVIGSIVYANDIRKDWIVNQVRHHNPKVVGVYKLAMKANSDNFRVSAIIDVLKELGKQTKVVIYEPELNATEFEGFIVENDFSKFTKLSDVIITNRKDDGLNNIGKPIYTRDLFGDN